MPPTGAETKVKDAEYKNWLRVGLALYYLKDGLHSFIQGEVDAFHQSLLQNLYGGSVVPKSQCSCCKSKDMKQNRNTYIWKFRSPCPSSLCDVWLTELMTFHTNPTSNKIYWENCDVTAWPFVPWECAKLYMPRGQPPANTGPSMSDSQALLTLMANCKYFHWKLSLTGLTLTHKVSTIRNRVMHSGDMRLSDGDRKSFIQDIIHLLEDPTHLISLEKCKQAVDEITRIDNDSIDVFFNVDLQIIALKTAVSEVRQELGMQEERTLDTVEALKEEYRQLREQLTTMLEAVETRMDTVENRQDTVENRVDTVENRMDTVENRQDTVENSVEAVENRVDTVENRMDTVENRMDTVENRQDTVETRMDTVENRQDTVENRVDTVETRMDTVENRQDTVENSVEAVEDRVDTVENRVDTVENRQDTVETRMDTVENSVEADENRVDTVENRVDTVENRVDTVENRQDTVETRMDTVENRVDTIERDVQLVKEQTDSALHKKRKLSESVETISASIATHGIRLDAVDENVKSLRTKLQKFETVTEQTDTTQQQQMKLSESMETMSAEVAENLVKLQEIGQRTGENNSCMKDISKLRDDLIKAYSNLRCIQVSPIFEKRRCDIDSIYVDLVIEEKQDKRNTQGKSKQSKVAQSHSKEPIEVTSYKQIFLDEKGSKFKRVYLRGKGGLGKTTFCRKVLHAWCNAHGGRAVAQNSYFQDEAVLQMFDLLFYMNLREVSVEENLIEVICAQFPLEDIPNKNILRALLKDNGDKVLFILDGLDEMIVKARFIENVVTLRVYPNCCFLVSSRPWKISQMELHEGTEIDLLLDLKGFSWINALKFAENIFRNCYEDGTVIKQFEKDVADNKLATQLIRVPLLLLFLAQVWYENERVLPSKLHELYILFFNLLVDRMKEKYKNDPNHRQMRFTLGDTQSPLPSKISETSLVANFGDGFLISLCEVAHHFLVSSQKHNSLVFEETKLQKALGDRGKEKLDLALDLGVLSVTDSVSYLNRKTNVSFLHKTMQEFFTALCFILSPDKLANFISSIADLNAVQQNENIIVFLVGLMPELGNKVLEKVNELCKDEWETLENGTRSEMFRFELDNISRIFLRCKEEVIGEDVLLNVSGLYLDYTQFDSHSWNPDFLQYLELRGFSYRHIFIDDVLVDLRGLTELTYLRLNEFPCDLYMPESGSLSALIINRTALSISCCDI